MKACTAAVIARKLYVFHMNTASSAHFLDCSGTHQCQLNEE